MVQIHATQGRHGRGAERALAAWLSSKCPPPGTDQASTSKCVCALSRVQHKDSLSEQVYVEASELCVLLLRAGQVQAVHLEDSTADQPE